MENLFREKTSDYQPVSQQASLARVSSNKKFKVRPMSPGESIYSPKSAMRTNSGDKKRQKCSWTKVRPEQQKMFNNKNILQKQTDMTDCQEK